MQKNDGGYEITKTSNDEGHVCLGQGQVKTGDRVSILKNVCTGKISDNRTCELEQVGMVTVESILNTHYSVVKFDSGVPFEEGSLVERK